MILRLAVLTQYRHVVDGQTDRETDKQKQDDSIYRASIASHDITIITITLLAISRPSGCTVASGVVVVGVVVVVVVGVYNRSQMRTSKCACLIFDVSVDLDPG